MADDLDIANDVFGTAVMKPSVGEEFNAIWGRRMAANIGAIWWHEVFAPVSVLSAYTFGSTGDDFISYVNNSPSATDDVVLSLPVIITGSRTLITADVWFEFSYTGFTTATVFPIIYKSDNGTWFDTGAGGGSAYSTDSGSVIRMSTGTLTHSLDFGSKSYFSVGVRGEFSPVSGGNTADVNLYGVQAWTFGSP